MRLHIHTFLTCLLTLLNHTNAQQSQSPLTSPKVPSPQPYRIAIIGAGAAGSSAAYHLSQYANTTQHDLRPLDITIFESTSHIGGRATTVNALSDPRYPVELGASIFVNINQILFNATRDFNLPSNDRIYENTGSSYDIGIWDGQTFVFTLPNRDDTSGLKGTLGSYWDIAKLLWKYGLSPIRLRNLQQTTISKFLRLYSDIFPFKDLTRAASAVDLLDTTGQSGTQILSANGISEKFSREIIQASSRVNYAQNLHDFHGLETMVCMSTEGAMSISGGNWQIFDRMIRSSGAKLNLNTTIAWIEHNEMLDMTILHDQNHESYYFDTVILAAPYNTSTGSSYSKPFISPEPPPIQKVDYVSLHVTLFTSPHRPSPSFFNLDSTDPQSINSIPDTILTTLPAPLDSLPLGRGESAVGPSTFWSLSTLRVLHPSTDGFESIPSTVSSGHIPLENLELNTTQYLYKIFSPAPLSASFMRELFGWEEDDTFSEHGEDREGERKSEDGISTLPNDLISWSYEKTWNSYPYLPPTREFDCFDMYGCGREDDEENSEQSRGQDSKNEQSRGQGYEYAQNDMSGRLWYTSGMERFISTMETSALAGRNVARLIVDGLERDARAKEMTGMEG